MRGLPLEHARVPLWAAATICAVGVAWRVWGTSYLGGNVVFDTAIVTHTLYASGPFRHTRNPLYFGLALYALGIALIGPPLTVLIVTCGMLLLNHALIEEEERRLRERFGESYADYARVVPRFFPASVARVPDDGPRPSLATGLRAEAVVIALAVVSFTAASIGRAA